jgi:nicotinate-nucleotide pyrophosphorylase (carboxylating)
MDKLDWTSVDRAIATALEEDIGAGDITAEATVSPQLRGIGQVIAKKPCVVAGLFLVERLFKRLSPDVEVTVLVPEGKKVNKGTVLCQVRGPYAALLLGERTLLNFLQRLCGIATLTSRFVKAVRKSPATKIYDTRKTTPGLRTLEKYAVRAGGGTNHRFGLYDSILIKENHIAAAGGVDKALRAARRMHKNRPLEVEVRTMEELVLAVEYGAEIVLLDNMSLAQIRKAATLVGQRVALEVSGGVDLKTARRIAENQVARISVGALTHSAPAADLSMLVVPEKRKGKT